MSALDTFQTRIIREFPDWNSAQELLKMKKGITPEALKAAKEMHIKMHKNNNQRGGYIKKYAKGGSVRKARY